MIGLALIILGAFAWVALAMREKPPVTPTAEPTSVAGAVEITLAGRLHAPRHLLSVLQILAVDKVGSILAKRENPGAETVNPWDQSEH